MTKMRWYLMVWMSITGLYSGAVQAGEKEARVLMQQATRLYADMEYERALKTLFQVLKTPGNSRAQLVRVNHLWGMSLASLGREEAGMTHAIKFWFNRGNLECSSVRARLDGEGMHRISIPAMAWERGKGWRGPVYLFAMVEDEHGGYLQRFGDTLHPFELKVMEGGGAVAEGESGCPCIQLRI